MEETTTMEVRLYLVGGQTIDIVIAEADFPDMVDQVGKHGPVEIDDAGDVHTVVLAEHISAIRALT